MDGGAGLKQTPEQEESKRRSLWLSMRAFIDVYCTISATGKVGAHVVWAPGTTKPWLAKCGLLYRGNMATLGRGDRNIHGLVVGEDGLRADAPLLQSPSFLLAPRSLFLPASPTFLISVLDPNEVLLALQQRHAAELCERKTLAWCARAGSPIFSYLVGSD